MDGVSGGGDATSELNEDQPAEDQVWEDYRRIARHGRASREASPPVQTTHGGQSSEKAFRAIGSRTEPTVPQRRHERRHGDIPEYQGRIWGYSWRYSAGNRWLNFVAFDSIPVSAPGVSHDAEASGRQRPTLSDHSSGSVAPAISSRSFT